MLSVIIPTITGREDSLKRCRDAYLETGPWGMEIVIVQNKANWPTACNAGARRATGDVLHFSADDLEPLPGWHEEALAWMEEHDELPAPRVFNHAADGPWDNFADGDDKSLTHFTRIPLMTRSQYDRIGAWPEIDYCSDVWVSEKGRTLGIQTRMIHSYSFVHYWSQVGRIDTPERLAASETALNELRRQM